MKRNKIAAVGAGVAAASLALSTLASPAGAGGAGHEHKHNKSTGGGSAIGLTADNKLVAFDLKLHSTRTLGAVSACTVTPGSSASTTACRTASSTASATPAASTRCRPQHWRRRSAS